MSVIRDKLMNMFPKIMAGTVTREEGAMLINDLVGEDQVETINELKFLIENPPPHVYQKTILHSIALARNKAFFSMMVEYLDHDNEELTSFAADELARLRSGESREVLVDHLNSDAYHVRKASANALAMGFGKEGIEVLKGHILTHHEPIYRTTSAYGLLAAGRNGLAALLEIVASDNTGAVCTAADVIASKSDIFTDEDCRMVVDALMHAGDRQESPSIVELLKTLASFGGRARSFEGYVLAFEDYPAEAVRHEAENTLRHIRA